MATPRISSYDPPCVGLKKLSIQKLVKMPEIGKYFVVVTRTQTSYFKVFMSISNLPLKPSTLILHKPRHRIRLVCIFCDHSSGDLTIAIAHLIIHLNYTPYKCRNCSKTFASMLEFTKHGKYHLDKKDLDFIYEPKEVLDDWLQKITMCYSNEKHLRLSPINGCMICTKYRNYFGSFDYLTSLYTLEDCEQDCRTKFMKETQIVLHPRNYRMLFMRPDDVRLLYHLHRHLQYFPFKCTKCTDKGNEFRVPFIGSEFREHLKTTHSITMNFNNANADCYEKTFYIEQLDWLVERFYRDSNEKKSDYRDNRNESKKMRR